MISKVFLVGRLTRDIDVRYAGENPVVDLGIAINRNWKRNGEKKEETTYVSVTVWGEQAENCSKYLGKGSLVCVDGRLKTDTWTDKQSGETRKKLKVIANSVKFLDTKGRKEKDKYYNQDDQYKQNNNIKEEIEEDEQVPF